MQTLHYSTHVNRFQPFLLLLKITVMKRSAMKTGEYSLLQSTQLGVHCFNLSPLQEWYGRQI